MDDEGKDEGESTTPVWDGITKSATLTPEAVAVRHRLADRARDYDWDGMLEILAQQPELVNATRPDGHSRYAVLHQAAHGGAPTGIVESLLALGAWRTLRTARGERPGDIAARHGHTRLVTLLQPTLHPQIEEDVLAALQRHFHLVVRDRAATLVDEHALRLPDVAVLLEMAAPRLWFPIPGMYGGFSVRLAAIEQEPILVVKSWCRVVEGSGQLHIVSPHGHLLVTEGFV